MLSQGIPNPTVLLETARKSLIKEDEHVEAKGAGFQSFLPGSEQAGIRLPVDALNTLICHVTLSGTKKRGEQSRSENEGTPFTSNILTLQSG